MGKVTIEEIRNFHFIYAGLRVGVVGAIDMGVALGWARLFS